MIEEGDTLPRFTLEGVDPDGNIKTYSSEELTDGSLLVLGVYVYDYSPVCTDQMCDISELEWLDMSENVNVVGISGDGPFSHQQFIKEHHIGYPLLCDTAEETLSDLGVLHEEKDGLRKVPQRSMFLVDADHVVRWRWVAGDNWDEWDSGPIQELDDRIRELGAENPSIGR